MGFLVDCGWVVCGLVVLITFGCGFGFLAASICMGWCMPFPDFVRWLGLASGFWVCVGYLVAVRVGFWQFLVSNCLVLTRV